MGSKSFKFLGKSEIYVRWYQWFQCVCVSCRHTKRKPLHCFTRKRSSISRNLTLSPNSHGFLSQLGNDCRSIESLFIPSCLQESCKKRIQILDSTSIFLKARNWYKQSADDVLPKGAKKGCEIAAKTLSLCRILNHPIHTIYRYNA